MAHMPDADETEAGWKQPNFERLVIDRARTGLIVLLGVLLTATTSAAAQIDGDGGGGGEGAGAGRGLELLNEFGTFLGDNGGGAIMVVVWVGIAGYIFWQGIGRTVTAFEHLGALDEETIAQGRSEGMQAAKTFLFALLGVPLVAAFVGRVFPDSWSWMGVDVTRYIQLPGTGGGEEVEQAAGTGTIYVPTDEIVSSVDVIVTVLPTLV